MKKLITETIIKNIDSGQKTLEIDKDTLLTPGAKDLARQKEIELVYVDECCCEGEEACEEPEQCATDTCCEEEVTAAKENCCEDQDIDRKEIVRSVIKALNDRGLLDEIMD